ncbi:hypothetical protein O9G_004996 [Rozella allomycis CSF55]|uniref:Ankyrin n=1 Tax=Rozella allomycis (strain CSF55) TaxID=988480 RepID=A0A075AZQ1_ROZAC|nr:hypothetical protein O9G_004996 [Rozella allomycis CSF55]|eukprot:EPZ34059.1 hypothetical protein O9G_004996 [Rozella allomycis CSF55]
MDLLKYSRADPGDRDNMAIWSASRNGHAENSSADPGDMGNLAIRLASQIGHTEVVKVLLNDSRVDPHNYAIASKNGHTAVVKLLLEG